MTKPEKKISVTLALPWTNPESKHEHKQGDKISLPATVARRLVRAGHARATDDRASDRALTGRPAPVPSQDDDANSEQQGSEINDDPARPNETQEN